MKYKILVIKGTRNPINLDLIASGIYSGKTELYSCNKSLNELKNEVIQFQKQISSDNYFFEIKDTLIENLNHIEFLDVDLNFSYDNKNFLLFEIEKEFIIPDIGKAPLKSKIIILDDKVYFKNSELEKDNSFLTNLSKEFILLNPKIFKPI